MSDTNGQQAKNWPSLNGKEGLKSTAAASRMVDAKNKSLVLAIAEVIRGYMEDARGTPSDYKYKNIVDLIIKRVKSVVTSSLKTFS